MAGARRTDPTTSHAAAYEVDASGRAACQRQICLHQVRQAPGLTAAEIAVCIGMERHAPSRRLPELRSQGLIRNGTNRICSETGRLSMTWEPALSG